MTTVYVVTVQYETRPSVRNLPEVFDSLDGAKIFVKELWGVNVLRITPSLWKAFGDDWVLSLDKRTVFKR